jgi:hypothetical protein
VTVSRSKETTSVTTAPSGKSKVGSSSGEGDYMGTEKPESIKKSSPKFGEASDETRSAVRKGLDSALDFFNLSKRHEQEFGKKAAKGGSVKRMRYGGSPEDGMDMGQPMRGGPRPAPEAPMNPNSIAYLQSKYGMRPQGGPPMKAGGKVKRMYDGGPPDGEMGPQPRSARLTLSEPEPQSARLTLSPEAPRGGGLAKLRQAIELPPERAPTPIERMPYQEPERQMPKMPDGEMVPRSPIEPPPRIPIEPPRAKFAPQPDNPSRGIKAGGQVKKMAQGGYAKADGVASRGKTQPKMVKMAKGGFVKTADGCAQRGKTKAFQVKMKRGGMC